MNEDPSTAWDDLFEALTLLRRSYSDTHSPLHCEHDELWVNANPDHFTAEELERLDQLGFFDSGEGFKSFRFGSA
jgi:hypothetical protein